MPYYAIEIICFFITSLKKKITTLVEGSVVLVSLSHLYVAALEKHRTDLRAS